MESTEDLNFPCPSRASESPPLQPLAHPGFSHSAIIFSGPVLRRLENHIRFPATYVGVRRVRPRAGAKVDVRGKRRKSTKSTNDGVDNREDDSWIPTAIGDGREKLPDSVGDCAMQNADNIENRSEDREGDKDQNHAINNSDTCDNSEDTHQKEVIYKVTNPDGTERRMTKQEKKLARNELRKARRDVHKEERQMQHQERIKTAKKEGRERRRLKRLAWNQRKEQQMQQRERSDCAEGSSAQSDNNFHGNDETKSDEMQKERCHRVEKPQSTSNEVDDAAQMNFPLYNEAHVDEELAALKGEKKGIPPVLLTPAASSVAVAIDALKCTSIDPNNNQRDEIADGADFSANVSSIMDYELSRQWALQLKKSMIPVEESRAKEKMRPMAYRIVPEVWKRLCPIQLWDPRQEASPNELTQPDIKSMPTDDSKPEQLSHSATLTKQQQNMHSFSLIRNPSPIFDRDAYFVFRHLHQHTKLHIACGAIFGCDFLLYDGRREDRHSFAGLRVYSNEGNFPIPSAYDMMGYVRAMNTARKLALVAMVIHPDHSGTCDISGCQNAPRVAIVDLALEKILEVETHVRKGNTVKRRSEEETASALGKKKQKEV